MYPAFIISLQEAIFMLNSENSFEKDKPTKDSSVNNPDADDYTGKKKKKKDKKPDKQIAEKISEEKDKSFSGKICKVREKDLKGKKLKLIKKIVAKPKFICLKCARVSCDKSNLCEPDKI